MSEFAIFQAPKIQFQTLLDFPGGGETNATSHAPPLPSHHFLSTAVGGS